MTHPNELADLCEGACPSRWVALGCSFGAFSAGMLLAGLLDTNGYEKLSEIVSRIAIVSAALVWWEVRRFKEVAAAIRANGGEHDHD